MKKRYGLKVYLDKDTNAAALSERLLGKARCVSDYIYVGVTNGMGAAVVSHGELYHGADGFVGEIGHVTAVSYTHLKHYTFKHLCGISKWQ